MVFAIIVAFTFLGLVLGALVGALLTLGPGPSSGHKQHACEVAPQPSAKSSPSSSLAKTPAVPQSVTRESARERRVEGRGPTSSDNMLAGDLLFWGLLFSMFASPSKSKHAGRKLKP